MTTTSARAAGSPGGTRVPAAEPSFGAVFAALRQLAQQLERQIGELAGQVRRDIEELARVIEDTRHELRELGPEELRRHHLALANGELDAVARHLEKATNEILDSCDALERLVEELPEERRGPFVDRLTRIYEACSFHDISGQRIRKVVNALDEVERRLGQLRRVYGATIEEAPAGGGVLPSGLCNGPSLPGEGTTQEQVDALLRDRDFRCD